MYFCRKGFHVLRLDEETIKRINQGDTKAFEKMYSTYYVYLCTIATKYIYDAETAKEIVNDVFINTWNNRATLNNPITAYLVRAVQNRCLNHIQRKRTQEVPLTDEQEQLLTIQEQAINANDHPLAWLEDKEFETLVSNAINSLPPKCKDIFQQYLYQHKSYEEIAESNGISASTVRVQIKIGLTKIKDILNKYYDLFLFLFF
jgi:RNA polymerase sigma-70 factor (ECF subfamily)